MGRAPALLTRPRAAAFIALAAAVVAYYEWRESLFRLSFWWAVVWLALVVIPAVLALVWLVLPLRRWAGLLPLGAAFGLLAWGCEQAGFHVTANFCKLAAATAVGFWFLGYFEQLSWVVLIALIVPWVDAYSVKAGPTHEIIKHRRNIFTALSFAFPVPGQPGAARLGLPDLLFYALFLAAAARFGLRLGWTWLALTLSFGATMALANAFAVAGLPALPLLALGFLLPNLDLIWRALRRRRAPAES